MKISTLSIFLAFLFFNIACTTSSSHHHHHHHHTNNLQEFPHCLTLHSRNSTSISQQIYTPNNSSYTPILQLNINNLRFNTSSTRKPTFIVTPVDESQIQTVIYCSKKHGLEMRIRCGGHDFEGLSYTADGPFVMLDLINMRSVTIDVVSKTAWVQGGATLGEVYYRISEKSRTLGFPGGTWSTVGAGGLLSGGGYGTMNRKYGLGGDNVIDVRMINADGRILTRKSMGEDLFWAIRGGGASSFGVIVAWKLRLVDVPEIVTVFGATRTLEQNATSLFHKWQYFAPNTDRNLFLRTQITTMASGTNKTVLLTFDAVFLGRADKLVDLMQESFPELGITRENCTEMSWVQSGLVISGFSSQDSPQTLLNRSAPFRYNIKGKADFVQTPIPLKGIEEMWRMLLEADTRVPNFILSPYGGRMNEISPSFTPFPHRAGNLYIMLQEARLDVDGPTTSDMRIDWLRRFYRYMARYVSKNPRSAYVNYNDLDLGKGSKSYGEAAIWGTKYFHGNFKKLVQVKSKVDPHNFFRHPQSIPAFPSF